MPLASNDGAALEPHPVGGGGMDLATERALARWWLPAISASVRALGTTLPPSVVTALALVRPECRKACPQNN